MFIRLFSMTHQVQSTLKFRVRSMDGRDLNGGKGLEWGEVGDSDSNFSSILHIC